VISCLTLCLSHFEIISTDDTKLPRK
jgi:hypothetical protein